MSEEGTAKQVWTLRPRPGVTPADLRSHCLDHARAVVAALAGPTTPSRVFISFVEGPALDGSAAPYQVLVEAYHDGIDGIAVGPTHLVAGLINPVGQVGLPLGRMAEEFTMGEKPGVSGLLRRQGQLKVVRLVNRRPDIDSAEFRRHWLSHHRELEREIVRTTPVLRIATTFPSLPVTEGLGATHDGMVEIYFASKTDMDEVFVGPIPAMMRRDEESFVKMDAPVVRVLAEEWWIG